MNAPQVSILIPVYNRQKFIGECIRSALNQTFSNIEVIIVDNASTDSTWNICEKYADRDSRVRIFRNEKNIGPVRNWIRCAQEAKGAYSKILFSDDLLEVNCIERMVEPLKSEDVGFVFCAAKIGTSKERSVLAYSNPLDRSIDTNQYVKLIVEGRAPVSPGAVLLRTSDLLKNLYTNFPTSTSRAYESNGAGPDVMIMLLTAEQYPKIEWIGRPLVFFRTHDNSFSVENKNSEITDGYTSVVSWYLINNKKRSDWIVYLTNAWFIRLGRGKLINPAHLLRSNEGDGRVSDLIVMIVAIPFVFASKIVGKIKFI